MSVDETARHLGLDGRHPAVVAVLLHAEIDRLAPLVVLVVVVAARVEAEVAAERAHVAQVWRRNLRGRLPQAVVRRFGMKRPDQFGQRHAGAEAIAVAIANASQLRDSPEADERPGTCCRRFMFGIEVSAARDDHRVARTGCRERPRRFSTALGRNEAEMRKAHHGRPSVAAFPRRRQREAAGGQSMAGNAEGRTRGGLPAALASQRLQNLFRCDRHFVDAHADRVVDGVGHRRHHRQQRSLSDFLRAERSASDPDLRSAKCSRRTSPSSSGSCIRASTETCARACEFARNVISSISTSPSPM